MIQCILVVVHCCTVCSFIDLLNTEYFSKAALLNSSTLWDPSNVWCLSMYWMIIPCKALHCNVGARGSRLEELRGANPCLVTRRSPGQKRSSPFPNPLCICILKLVFVYLFNPCLVSGHSPVATSKEATSSSSSPKNVLCPYLHSSVSRFWILVLHTS